MEACPNCKEDGQLFYTSVEITTGDLVWKCQSCGLYGKGLTADLICKPYFVKRPILNPRSPVSPYSPSLVASYYSFPRDKKGSVPTVALIQLGGGYSTSQIGGWCQRLGYPNPNLTDLLVDGATNNYHNDAGSADVEVALDIACVVGAIYYMTGQPANILVVFAPNSTQGFINAIKAVNQKNVASCGISWGSAERNWTKQGMEGMNAAFRAGAEVYGITYCTAAGDHGSGDGYPGDNVDFPGSAPDAVCCGGTSIVVNGGGITNEVIWNRDGGATGGGYSAVNPVSDWQKVFLPQGKTTRGVPDLSAFADPQPGWDTPFGPVGGTSAVAPFMAAYFAVLKMVSGRSTGLVNPFLYRNEPCFRDLVVGNNGTQSATQGWDSASGLGAPLGSRLLDTWLAEKPVEPPPAPPPVLRQEPTQQEILTVVQQYFSRLQTKNPYYKDLLVELSKGVSKTISGVYDAQVPMSILERMKGDFREVSFQSPASIEELLKWSI